MLMRRKLSLSSQVDPHPFFQHLLLIYSNYCYLLLLRSSCRNSDIYVAPIFFVFMVLHMRELKSNPGSPQFAFTLQEEQADPGRTCLERWATLTWVKPGLVAFTLREFNPGYFNLGGTRLKFRSVNRAYA